MLSVSVLIAAKLAELIFEADTRRTSSIARNSFLHLEFHFWSPCSTYLLPIILYSLMSTVPTIKQMLPIRNSHTHSNANGKAIRVQYIAQDITASKM